MKSFFSFTLVLFLAACSASESGDGEAKSGENETLESATLTLVNPCSIITKEVLSSAFKVAAPSTLEMYERKPYENAKQCQFLWTESENSTQSSQIMVDIMVNMKGYESPAAYSRMLEMDLLNGLMDRKQQIIYPTAVGDLGKGAYYWIEGSMDNTQKIKFQVNENYMVQVLFNSNFNTPYEDVEQKLIELATTIKQQLTK